MSAGDAGPPPEGPPVTRFALWLQPQQYFAPNGCNIIELEQYLISTKNAICYQQLCLVTCLGVPGCVPAWRRPCLTGSLPRGVSTATTDDDACRDDDVPATTDDEN